MYSLSRLWYCLVSRKPESAKTRTVSKPRKKSTNDQPRYHKASSLKIDPALISRGAVTAVKQLNQAGFSAYLVGGCIRDLMLGAAPKDFDISTGATPGQTQRLFHRSRIIGQRFKIVHVRIKGELLEVSTYRQAVKDHHKDKITGQVLDDNVFGTIEEDASRRDFTVNAFYYDVNTNQVIDFFNGIDDLWNNKLVVIGDPDIRFAEDPGRILRTVRFQAKFDFDVDDEVVEAIYRQKHLLNNIPPARRFDEILKLFYCGQASRVWELLNEYQLLPYLFARPDDDQSPEAVLSGQLTTMALESTDRRIRQGKPVISAFMFCAILWPFYHTRFKTLLGKGLDPQDAMVQASEAVIAGQLVRTGMLRRVTNTIRDVWWLQYRMEKANKKRQIKILEDPRFRAAYDFLLIRAEAGDVDPQTAEFWTRIQSDKSLSTSKKYAASTAKPDRSPRRRRNRNRKRGAPDN